MRFSEVYGPFEHTDADDWFDVFLPADSRFCVDPFLIYEDDSPMWANAHDRVLDFFAVAFDLVRQSRGNQQSDHWKKAERLLKFPEPAEFCLGVAEGSPMGAGSGKGLQVGMLEGISVALAHGLDNVPHIEMLALFEGGMGLDRISDAVCNILKDYFVRYTQEICRRHNIPMSRYKIKNGSWSEQFARWNEPYVELPSNPFYNRPDKRLAVLLTPEKFLRDIPVVTTNGFWRYAWTTHSKDLRGDFNWDIARRVPKHVKARMARQNIPVVQEYLDKLEQEKHDPYDMLSDPNLLVNWYEMGGGFSSRSPLSFIPSKPEEFGRFAEAIVAAFKHNIEEQDGWQQLWYRTKSLPERRVQMVFRSAVIHYCRAHNIALSGEPNAGRGPVDFKFSQDWHAQSLVEIKLMRNSKFWDGILAQTKQYAISEEVAHAIFIAIAYTDDEMKPERLDKVRQAAEIASRTGPISIVPLIVDARRKVSASKLKASTADHDELHRGQTVQDTDLEEDADDLDDEEF